MLGALRRGIFGSRSDRILRGYPKIVADINARESQLALLSDSALAAQTPMLREKASGGATAESLLPEAFAVMREASRRALGMRHFDVQLLGGIALFEGKIAEMKTGEGKTLVATLPVYLHALLGKGAHVVTVNDYLARRDAEWMGKAYRFLGISIGVNVSGMSAEEKRAAYQSDVTYGTNNEFGFDYLRDNMRITSDSETQKSRAFAIVDEVDSILIDEARTPLIISGEAEDSVELYQQADAIAADFVRASTKEEDEGEPDGDFFVDEKTRQVNLSESGYTRAEKIFASRGLLKEEEGGLYDAANLPLLHHLSAALRANHLYFRDQEYVVQNGEVIIVDEFTGRLMPGRRWGDGLHQAVEAKEGLKVQRENQTLASITFQNYFRLYDKIAGMTGTAVTEAHEFEYIYGLETVEIPTHAEMVRDDQLDKVYQTAAAKYPAVIEDIAESAKRRQPTLVGTTSIENSEKISAMLKKANLPHQVLNAKQHASEAQIVAQAGMPGAITIATNMAGRGTDIVLGGSIDAEIRALDKDESILDSEKESRAMELRKQWEQRHREVVEAGGLRIIGTERHESRRVDNQLRGRSGRQGDPGSSVFYLSFEDPLLRIFASERVSSIMHRLKIEEDEAIEAGMVSRVIENAQRKVEAHNFDIRKQLLEYDDFASEQRKIIYTQREEILNAQEIQSVGRALREQHLEELCARHLPPESPEEEWEADALEKRLAAELRLHLPIAEWITVDKKMTRDILAKKITDEAENNYREKTAEVEAERLADFERALILNVMDSHWRGHLSALDHLRQSVGLRGFAQKNPKQEYKREAFQMFNTMLDGVRADVARILYGLRVRAEGQAPPPLPESQTRNIRYHHDSAAATPPPPPPDAAGGESSSSVVRTYRREEPKVRRNDPCPCGSGKKYKHCHGKLK